MSELLAFNNHVTYVSVAKLKHIEGFSQKRVDWLVKKIRSEHCWTKPLCVDKAHSLVMDGQHRMEAAKILGLPYVPCILFDYDTVKIWSLRDNYFVDHATVIKRSLENNIYPYKTVKHEFPSEIPALTIPLQELINLELDVV